MCFDAKFTSAQPLSPIKPLRQVPSKPLSKPAPEETSSVPRPQGPQPSVGGTFKLQAFKLRIQLQLVCYSAFHGTPDPRKAATVIVSCTAFVGSRKIESLSRPKLVLSRQWVAANFLQYVNQVRIIQISSSIYNNNHTLYYLFKQRIWWGVKSKYND
ncbi:hypothetical protein V8E52_011838 [Russula decolorans]